MSHVHMAPVRVQKELPSLPEKKVHTSKPLSCTFPPRAVAIQGLVHSPPPRSRPGVNLREGSVGRLGKVPTFHRTSDNRLCPCAHPMSLALLAAFQIFPIFPKVLPYLPPTTPLVSPSLSLPRVSVCVCVVASFVPPQNNIIAFPFFSRLDEPDRDTSNFLTNLGS